MALNNTVRLLVIAFVLGAPLLCGAPGQNRPASPRPSSAGTQNSKARDKNWLKAQVRRRYGASALPEKTDVNLTDKKTQPNSSAKQAAPKN